MCFVMSTKGSKLTNKDTQAPLEIVLNAHSKRKTTTAVSYLEAQEAKALRSDGWLKPGFAYILFTASLWST